MPLTVGVITGVATDELKLAGPDHAYAFVPFAGLAANVTDPVPKHIGLVLVGAAVGIGFTVTVVV